MFDQVCSSERSGSARLNGNASVLCEFAGKPRLIAPVNPAGLKGLLRVTVRVKCHGRAIQIAAFVSPSLTL